MSGRHTFPVRGSEEIYSGAVMTLRADQVEMPGGRVAKREIVEHPGAVAIAALDAEDRLAMIFQYRHAVARRLWEMPAGLLDHADEDPLEAAKRELAEEAGVAATEWSVLVDTVASPGYSDESVRVFLARGTSVVARPDLGSDDEEADLTLEWIPLAEAVRMTLAGEIVNATTVAAVLATHAALGLNAELRPADAGWEDRPTRFSARREAARPV